MENIVFPDNVKKYIELQCNSALFKYTHFPELENIQDELKVFNPKNVLEIGSGIGRASVFLFKHFGWQGTNFYLLDGDSGEKQISGINYESKDGFYNSIEAAEEFCAANGMDSVYMLNAEEDYWKTIDVKFDLCYSFLAIGFHWSISLYLEDVYDLLEEDAILIFGIRTKAERFDVFMDKQIDSIDKRHYEVLKLIREPEGVRSSVLMLRRK